MRFLFLSLVVDDSARILILAPWRLGRILIFNTLSLALPFVVVHDDNASVLLRTGRLWREELSGFLLVCGVLRVYQLRCELQQVNSTNDGASSVA